MKIHKIAYVLLTSTFIVGLATSLAQAADAPKDNKGYTTGKTVTVELGPEFAGMDGRQLRLRVPSSRVIVSVPCRKYTTAGRSLCDCEGQYGRASD